MRDFFIGLIFCLDQSKKNVPVEKIIKNKFFSEEQKFTFHKNSNNFDFNLFNIDNDNIHIEVIEYAPRVFKKIRLLEELTEDELIESLNPLNNTKIIKSQGKSSSFFISTDDSKIVLKTLQKEEFDTIFDKFLFFYLHYLENNNDSLICRIYGIFSIKANDCADPLLIILMRDARGPLQKV
jgi:hypothetical protein